MRWVVYRNKLKNWLYSKTAFLDLLVLFAAHIVIWARKELTKMKRLTMRKVNSSACFGICFILASVCLYADTSIFSSQSDREARIKQLEEEISVHQQRARFAEREAGRLLPLDFSSYQRYLKMQEKNEQQAEELQRELDRLQGKR